MIDTLSTDTTTLQQLEDPAFGFCVLRGLGTSHDPAAAARRLDICLHASYHNIQVFDAHPTWKPIKVDLTREPHRVGGVGLIPLHLDFVNMEYPPDLVVLWCTMSDSTGGGRSLLCPIGRLVEACQGDLLERMKKTSISEGQAFGLNNVGDAMASFRLFDASRPFPLRFTGKILSVNPTHPQRSTLCEIDAAATRLATRLTLDVGDMLLVNQRLCLHGREALGVTASGAVDSDRIVMQRFYRLNREPSGR